MIEAKILKPGYTQKEALVLLFNTDPKLDLLDIDEVYYPYVRLRYLITVGKGRIMKKLNKLCDCIIDRVSGSVYETEGDPELIMLKFRRMKRWRSRRRSMNVMTRVIPLR